MNLWDWKAKLYDRSRKIFPFSVVLTKELENVRELLGNVSTNQQPVLDLGTGTGTMLKLLPQTSKVFAVDTSRAMIHEARSKSIGELLVADSCFLPFKEDSFRLVTAVGLFEYQRDSLSFLKEIRRVTKPSGCALLTYSQFSALNVLRFLLGQRLYLTTAEGLRQRIGAVGYSVAAMRKSLMQRQMLMYNSPGELSE